jgi:hypothetical protein
MTKIHDSSYTQFFKRLVKLFKKLEIEYMVLGGASALIQGFNIVTQDVDLYIDKNQDNEEKLIKALTKLGFNLNEKDKKNIMNGKDFIQFNEPYEIDIVFSPDGFENYNQAKPYKIFVDNIPLMNLEGIIKSKKAANRPKDKVVLPSLIDFLKFKKSNKESFIKSENYFELVPGYKVTDNQTMSRWIKNERRTLEETLNRGILTI